MRYTFVSKRGFILFSIIIFYTVQSQWDSDSACSMILLMQYLSLIFTVGDIGSNTIMDMIKIVELVDLFFLKTMTIQDLYKIGYGNCN